MSDSFKQAIIKLTKDKGIDIDENKLGIEWPDLSVVSTWISVNDALPEIVDGEKYVTVLGWIAPHGIVSNGCYEPVEFDGENWFDSEYRTCTVTHWQKVEPPKQ